MGLYNFGKPKVYAAFEHIQYANPNSPLAAGVDTIGGYKLAFVNNTAYTNDKDVNVYWVGATYTLLSKLDVTADFYLIHQNAYGTGKNLDCHGTQSGTCSGQEDVFSVTADYRFSKRFDVYAGVMYSEVQGGLASGFIYNTNNYNPTIGARYKF